jgi:hypothetical protein
LLQTLCSAADKSPLSTMRDQKPAQGIGTTPLNHATFEREK